MKSEIHIKRGRPLTFAHLQVDEHGDVEEQGEDGHGGDVHGQMPPPGRGPEVDPVGVRVADCEVPLEGQGHDHED